MVISHLFWCIFLYFRVPVSLMESNQHSLKRSCLVHNKRNRLAVAASVIT